MIPSSILELPDETRHNVFQHVIAEIEKYTEQVGEHGVSPPLDVNSIRKNISRFNFEEPANPIEAVDLVVNNLWKYQVHTPHPMYFGLFNPRPTTMGIVADALAAAFNPQLAAWSHSPFAVEVEQYLIHEFGKRFGYDEKSVDGTFASGGAEANHTAILTALNWKFPEFSHAGLRGCAKQPRLYVTSQSHHSFAKAARLCGLGNAAVKEIPLDTYHRMDVNALRSQITQDRNGSFEPFFIDATGGSTNAGIIDPIANLAEIAQQEKLWLHVDAAWGGAAVMVPELKDALAGIERADSITFDAHKWLSVPMGAGMFLTRHRNILDETFRVTTDYMPKEGAELEKIEPYQHSMQWSRRFIGLKVFMSLLVAGWDGYAAVIRHQTTMGNLLRNELVKHNWEIVNDTPLPTVCFVDTLRHDGRTAHFIDTAAANVVASGKAWISSTRLGNNLPVLRACITNYQTQEKDIFALVEIVNNVREEMK